MSKVAPAGQARAAVAQVAPRSGGEGEGGHGTIKELELLQAMMMNSKMEMGMGIKMEMGMRMKVMMLSVCFLCAPRQPPRGLTRRNSRRRLEQLAPLSRASRAAAARDQLAPTS